MAAPTHEQLIKLGDQIGKELPGRGYVLLVFSKMHPDTSISVTNVGDELAWAAIEAAVMKHELKKEK